MNSAFHPQDPQITDSSQALHGEKGLTFVLGTSCPILRARASGDQNPGPLLQPGFDLRVRAAASPLLSPPLHVSLPLPSPYRSRGGGGKTRGARTGPQPMLWRAAGPAPSFPPARPNRNLLQCCGEPGGRGAGGPRAAPASSRGGKAGGRAPGLLARSSLSPSLPPSASGFSQLACSPPAPEPQRAGASDAGAASCHCSSG